MSVAVDLKPSRAENASFNIRLTLALVGAVATLASCFGYTTQFLFSEPSTLKYAVSVVVPLCLVLLAGSANPLRVLVGLMIVAAPFSIGISAEGIGATPFAVLMIASIGLYAFVATGTGRPTGMAVAIPVWIALLTFAVARATSPRHFLLLLGAMLAAGLLAKGLASESGGTEFLLGSIVFAAFVQSSIAIWEFKTHHLLDAYSASGQTSFGNQYFFSFLNLDRPPAGFADPISLGNVLAISIPLALALCLHTTSMFRRIVAAVAIAPIGLGLSLTLSRMSWVGASAGVLVFLLFLPGRRLRASVVVAAMATIAIAVALTLGGDALRERFSSLSNPTAAGVKTASSDRTREDLWHGALLVAEKHEIAGVGFGRLGGELPRFVAGASPDTHAHSTYLQVFAEAGVLGLAAIAAVLLAAFGGAFVARSRGSALAAGLMGSLVAMLVCWSTDFTVRYIQVAVFMALIVGAAAGVGARLRPLSAR